MATPPSYLAALKDYLKADPDIASLTGGRVWASELPPGENSSMPRMAVVIQAAGGLGSASDSKFYRPRVIVRAYGKSTAEAEKLMLKCQDVLLALKRQKLGTCLLYSATPIGGPNITRDILTNWPFAFSTWQVATNLYEV